MIKFGKPTLSIFIILTSILLFSCGHNKSEQNAWEESVNTGLWLNYSKEATEFKIWSPSAEKVKLNLYHDGNTGEPFETHEMRTQTDSIWAKKLEGDLNGTYYTYQIMVNGKWLDETPGIYAQAAGVNGKRAMVIDLRSTNPSDWCEDKGPEIKSPNDAIIYELHIRDITIQTESGSSLPGKYLGLVEEGTTGPGGVSTGIDHLKELGITHVHLLPAFDHYYLDETKLDTPQFNWGYDPLNYNVPDGSYSSDPYKAEVRIKEFKEMVKAFHANGIGVILDVVYNHTATTGNSNFDLEAPGYYYRKWDDGSLSNASGCGNETASEKKMMREYILASVSYWANEYHIDGFRFDLMGIHDITTMTAVAKRVKEINPNIIVYGEGWTAGDSPLPEAERALKKHVVEMPQISAFSDDIRDGLKGSVFDDLSTGFVSGAKGTEESIKFGVVGSIQHPQIDYAAVNYSNAPWAIEPWQSISYVSCHDNHTLYDKLKVSRRGASEEEIVAMDKLANAIVMTSQGIAFMHAGAEMLRTKNGEHNSFNLPDEINRIDWNMKVKNKTVFNYYKNLIALRKNHPAFRMQTGEDVRKNLVFKKVENGLVSYQISNHANNDEWKNIYVIYNARTEIVDYELKGEWQLAVLGEEFYLSDDRSVNDRVQVPAISMLIAYQK